MTPTDGEINTFTGRVRAGPVVHAPLSGKPCVAYAVSAKINERQIGMQWGGNKVLAVIDHCELVPFELETRDGVIYVVGPDVDVTVPPATRVPRKIELERAFLATHADASVDLRATIFTERRVAPGDVVSVTGVVAIEVVRAEPEVGFRETGSRVRLISFARHPIQIGSAR